MSNPAVLDENKSETQESKPVDGWLPLIRFTARGSDFFWLILKNFFFTIITLGIYSFWGKTRVRAFLWRNTYVWGDPLEYTGTGSELFIGFLIACPVLLVVTLGPMFMFVWLGLPFVGALVFFFTFLFLAGYATYTGLRYRLTRTRWRGIRGNISGSPVTFAVKAMLYYCMTIFSIGLLTPVAVTNMTKQLIGNVHLGDRRFAFNGVASTLYKTFLIYLLSVAGLIGIFLLLAYEPLQRLELGLVTPEDLGIIFTGYIVLLIGILFASTAWEAAIIRWFYGGLGLGKVAFRSTISAWALLKLRFVNLVLLICTLLIALPWVILRTKRLVFHSLEYAGEPDFAQLKQDKRDAPEFGEGMMDALDIDIAL